MNKLSPLFFLLAACGPALAENTAGLMMPDGSRDMYVGIGVATRTAVAAGEDRPVSLRPLLQVQWSNGIFVSATGVAGMHLSETAGVEYGPLLVDSNSRDPGESRRLRGTHPVKGSPDVGGFYNYYLGDNARILSSAVYDTSAHGFKGQLGMQKSWSSLAPHHTVSLSAGVSLASDPVARELYEVSTASGGVRDYRPSGGDGDERGRQLELGVEQQVADQQLRDGHAPGHDACRKSHRRAPQLHHLVQRTGVPVLSAICSGSSCSALPCCHRSPARRRSRTDRLPHGVPADDLV